MGDDETKGIEEIDAGIELSLTPAGEAAMAACKFGAKQEIAKELGLPPDSDAVTEAIAMRIVKVGEEISAKYKVWEFLIFAGYFLGRTVTNMPPAIREAAIASVEEHRKKRKRPLVDWDKVEKEPRQ